MVKRGGRPERSREVQLPLSGELAAVLQQRDAQEAAERAQIKRLTLQVAKAARSPRTPLLLPRLCRACNGMDVQS